MLEGEGWEGSKQDVQPIVSNSWLELQHPWLGRACQEYPLSACLGVFIKEPNALCLD